jgi:hypothetical protein
VVRLIHCIHRDIENFTSTHVWAAILRDLRDDFFAYTASSRNALPGIFGLHKFVEVSKQIFWDLGLLDQVASVKSTPWQQVRDGVPCLAEGKRFPAQCKQEMLEFWQT